MTTAIAETFSRVDDSDCAVLTRGMSPDEWFLPERESADRNNGETTADQLSASASSPTAVTTALPLSTKVSRPVRKDKLRIRLSDRGIKLLQQWECIVLDVREDCVECEMHDLTDDTRSVEFAEIYLDEFNRFDRPLLAEGTVFYWSIGREESTSGTIRRYSELRVRRMPPLSKLRTLEIAQEADRLRELITN
jgi:hypothetical protein